MTDSPDAVRVSCDECAASATCALSYFECERPTTALLCDGCWRRRRGTAGVENLEGPLAWGADWPEVLAWLDRSLEEVLSHRLRQLIAHELHRQIGHLPRPWPARANAFLAECGYPLI